MHFKAFAVCLISDKGTVEVEANARQFYASATVGISEIPIFACRFGKFQGSQPGFLSFSHFFLLWIAEKRPATPKQTDIVRYLTAL